MDFFFIILVIGVVVLIATRFSQMSTDKPTVHCLHHKWMIDPVTREMHCETCKARPE